MPGAKTEWPELVGVEGSRAKSIILSENPLLEVDVYPEDGMFTCDFRVDRVRILIGKKGNVSQVPRTG
jgi:hypothetical protein